MNTDNLDPIEIALREDIGPGDITAEYFVDPAIQANAQIVARENAVVAGAGIAADVFRRVDAALNVEIVKPDGAEVAPNDPIIRISGRARSILTAERVALNFLQRLSGIATLTKSFVQAAANEHVQILDTRKTIPGLRALEKAAVVAGGGANHRLGLHDMVLVKDNHLICQRDWQAIAATVQRIRAERPGLQIEIEADDLRQVKAILRHVDVDLILLDNMRPAQLREAVALAKGTKVKLEASGGVNLKNVRIIAATGVDFISVGALTHSARAIDFSLELIHAGA